MTKRILAIVLPAALLLSGCLGTVMETLCELTPDSDHCYQAAAVQEANPETCEKVSGKDFKYQNPPKDKCYLLIAENTGDPSSCDKIEGGFTSYTPEECFTAAWKDHSPEDCAKADDEAACRNAWGSHGKGCGDGYVWNAGAKSCDVIASSSSSAAGSDDDIENKAAADLHTIKDAATGKYMDLLTKDIENETDPARLAGLQKYKEFLEKAGGAIETVTTTVDQLKELKKIFLDSYDPSMAIENMPVDKILAKGLVDRIKDGLFGESKPDARSQADDALSVYDAMLKRQKDNDFLQQSRLTRVGDTVVSTIKDKATDKLKESAEEIAKGVAGDAFAVVGIVDHALTSFKEAAQKEMFVGLASAYNRQRDSIAAANPGLSPEEIHKRTVASVKEDPYQDVPNSGFVKYGNLLENGDCKDANNPLCIDNRVFWTAMDKSYEFSHKK